ncbi:MAG: DUF6883 domain-containing protein [Thermoanaerobaculia bacterium]
MKIPGANKAMVDPAKVRDYLVSPEHPVGRFKAVFFASLGYSRANWPALQAEFQRLALSDDAVAGVPSDFGQKFEVRATLDGPSGRRAAVVVVWIVLKGEQVPRFVTAFPGDSK